MAFKFLVVAVASCFENARDCSCIHSLSRHLPAQTSSQICLLPVVKGSTGMCFVVRAHLAWNITGVQEHARGALGRNKNSVTCEQQDQLEFAGKTPTGVSRAADERCGNGPQRHVTDGNMDCPDCPRIFSTEHLVQEAARRWLFANHKMTARILGVYQWHCSRN